MLGGAHLLELLCRKHFRRRGGNVWTVVRAEGAAVCQLGSTVAFCLTHPLAVDSLAGPTSTPRGWMGISADACVFFASGSAV